MWIRPRKTVAQWLGRPAEEATPIGEEVIGRAAVKYCPAHDTDAHDFDECGSIIRPGDPRLLCWPGSGVVRGESFDEVMERNRFWTRFRGGR